MMTHEQAEQKAAKLMDKLSGNGVVEWFSHGACLKEIAAALLDCQKDTEHKWPDIGQDPLQMEKRDSFEESFARLKSGLNKQQAGVPDQTALVWRVDISRVSDEVILQRARGESFMSTMERVKTLESEIASQKDAVKEVCEVLERAASVWNRQSGRVFESMWRDNPRTQAIDASMTELAALLNKLKEL